MNIHFFDPDPVVNARYLDDARSLLGVEDC